MMYILSVTTSYMRKGSNMICKAMYYYFVRNYSIYLSFYIGIFIIYLFYIYYIFIQSSTQEDQSSQQFSNLNVTFKNSSNCYS